MPTKMYNSKPWLRLYRKLPKYPDSKFGSFCLKTDTIPAGTVLQGYNEQEGRFEYIKHYDDFPISKLYEINREIETLWMSTAQLELAAMVNPVKLAHGQVLTCGLGMGVFAYLVSQNPKVKTVTVVERSQDVISLITPIVWNRKLEVICSDLQSFIETKSEQKFDFIFLDIWSSLLGPINDALTYKVQVQPLLADGGRVYLWLQELIDRVLDKLPKTPVIPLEAPRIQMPCLVCSKTLRYDYAGLCMDCADELKVSEITISRSNMTI